MWLLRIFFLSFLLATNPSALFAQVLTPTAMYSIPANGGVSFATTGSNDSLANINWALSQTSTGSIAPTGVAIFGLRTGGVLVTEAGVPASPQLISGRMYVEIGGAV